MRIPWKTETCLSIGGWILCVFLKSGCNSLSGILKIGKTIVFGVIAPKPDNNMRLWKPDLVSGAIETCDMYRKEGQIFSIEKPKYILVGML